MTKTLFKERKTIAVICAAATYLNKQGFLDNLKHTSNDICYLKEIETQYSLERNYINSLAITDEDVINANGIAPIEFSKEIFEKSKIE